MIGAEPAQRRSHVLLARLVPAYRERNDSFADALGNRRAWRAPKVNREGAMAGKLEGKRIAMLVTTGFEEVEMVEPRRALESAGAEVELIAPDAGQVRAWDRTEWGESFGVDRALDAARPSEYDALVLPGGVMNPDRLRMNPQAVEFARAFIEAGKPLASICHGPWLLVEADVVRGRTMTSYPSLRTDLENAGAKWVDQEVVSEGGVVTSRSPRDIPAFNRAMIEEFARSTTAA